MSKKIELDKKFVKNALEVYRNLTNEELVHLKYKSLIRKIMQEIHGENFLESHVKRGYENFPEK